MKISAVFVADGQKTRQMLGWPPRVDGLGTIVEYTWEWKRQKAMFW